jgi:crossover junction endodeoxyribonuclease RuvC
MTIYLGVDPGATGAIAAVHHDGFLLWVEDMPDPLHGAAIRALLDDPMTFQDYVAAIELVGTRPGQGLASSGKFMKAAGLVEGALGYALIPYRLVTPGQWKKAMRVTADKDTARTRAIELWPSHADSFKRKKDHGRAEAALIARWLYEQSRVTVAA